MWIKQGVSVLAFIGAMLFAQISFAQSDDADWQQITSIEIDLAVSDLAPRTTAIVLKCEVYTRAPNGIAGYGYMVLFDPAQHESPANNMRADNDVWLDRIAFEPVENLVSSGLSEKVFVPVYGDEVDYRFWNKGQCQLNLYFNDVSQLSYIDIQGNLAIPIDCADLAGEEFYRLADWCVAPGYSPENAIFSFERNDVADETEASGRDGG